MLAMGLIVVNSIQELSHFFAYLTSLVRVVQNTHILHYFLNKDIIKVYNQKDAYQETHRIIHEALKHEWNIAKEKWHHYKHIFSFMCVEGYFRNVHLHFYLTVSWVKVLFSK